MATVGKTIEDYKAEYNAAKARGDSAAMQAANDGANKIRESQGVAKEYATDDIASTAAKSGAASTPPAQTYTPSTGTTTPSRSPGTDDYGNVDYSTKWDNAVASGADYNTLLGIYNDRLNKASQDGVYSPYHNDTKQQEMLSVLDGMKKTTQATQTTGANDYSSYIESMNKAQQAAALEALRAAYNKNVAGLDRAQEAIAPEYRSARNEAAGQSELQKRNFAEYAAANGLNSGAGGQAQLSFTNALQGNLSNIAAKEASTMADLELQRSQMETDYNSAIAQAKAQGNYELAQQLYTEKVRQDEAIRQQMQWQAQQDLQTQQFQWQQSQANVANNQWEQNFNQGTEQYNQTWALKMAQELAQYGNFEGYKALGYTDAQIQSMKDTYSALQRQAAAKNATSTSKSADSTYGDPDKLYQDAYNSGQGVAYIMMNAAKYGISASQIDGMISNYQDWEQGADSSGNYDAAKSTVDTMLYSLGRQGISEQEIGNRVVAYLNSATITGSERQKLAQYVARLMKLE